MRSQRIGQYQPIALLARGGQAEVYLAVSNEPDARLVAVKRLDPTADPRFTIEMFADEASLARCLRHPNIVHTYETGGAGGDHYIAMEYLDGQTLSRIRRVIPVIAPEVWAWFAAEALAGLGHAHAACDPQGRHLGIVHCDVSPQNVFVTYDGKVKIIDFGIALSSMSSTESAPALAGDGVDKTLRGKVQYMAPEQALGSTDPRSDLFSVGIMLWEALAQRRLYAGDRSDVLKALLGSPAPSLASVAPGIDPELEHIVRVALARDPSARFQTAGEMREALLGFIQRAGRPVTPARVASLLEAPFRQARDQKRALLEQRLEQQRSGEQTPHEPLAVIAGPPSSRSLAIIAGPPSSRSLVAVSAHKDNEREPETTTLPRAETASLVPPILATVPPPLQVASRLRLVVGAAAVAIAVTATLRHVVGGDKVSASSAPAVNGELSRRVASETTSPMIVPSGSRARPPLPMPSSVLSVTPP